MFDVESARDLYGPGASYHVFAGRNATYGLATSSLDSKKLNGDISTVSEMEKDTHLQWYNKYNSKYPVAGFLVPDDYAASGSKKDS